MIRHAKKPEMFESNIQVIPIEKKENPDQGDIDRFGVALNEFRKEKGIDPASKEDIERCYYILKNLDYKMFYQFKNDSRYS